MLTVKLIRNIQFKTNYALSIIMLSALSFLFVSQFTMADTIKVAVFEDHYSVISQYGSNELCPDLKTADFKNNQMLAEFFIFCNALKVMKYKPSFELVPYPISIRALQAIEKEDVMTSGYGVWYQELSAHHLTGSAPLLNKSEFTKGLYTTKALSQKLALAEQFKPSELIVGANQNWQLDWQELKCAGFNVLHVNQYEQMIKMVKLGRVDLLPFVFGPEEDLHQTIFGITIYPVNGIKVPIQDSLHFAINTTSTQGQELHRALELGLKQLRQQGLIKDVYKKLGIINPRLDSWRSLGCNQQ